MTAVGKLAKEKVSHLFFSKGEFIFIPHAMPVGNMLKGTGILFDHIDLLRSAAREMAAVAIKKSGQF
jgi:hypothetical protein